MPAGGGPVRCLALWFPDWPVTAWLRIEAGQAEGPVAVVLANEVTAASSGARGRGVKPGLSRREALGRCPELRVVPADPGRDQRVFAQLVDRIEQVSPGVQVIRPGLCALRVRGPARFYGGEEAAAVALLRAAAEFGVHGGRAGVADGVFTALQAATVAEPILTVDVGTSAEFLAPLSVARLGDDELGSLLPRLGVRTLGEFAALDAKLVRDRFGDRGRRLQALSGGLDSRPVVPAEPRPELTRQVEFEPPLALVDQVAFSLRTTAEDFIAGLAAARLVCTELRVELVAELGERVERVWLHPGAFDSAAVVDRVRWQLQAAAGEQLNSGVVQVRLVPAAVDGAEHHEPGLFSSGADERVHHTMSRVQAMLGHRGVLTPRVGGGRRLADRQVLVAWGDRAVVGQQRERPWPGSLPAPLPATVFSVPRPVGVLDEGGRPVTVDDRGAVSMPPAVLVDQRSRRPIQDWAGPWPLDEYDWDPQRHRTACRFQVVDEAQAAWLLLLDDQARWWVEARYD